MTARLDSLPPREHVVSQGGWRVAHAFNSSLPGWLILVPMRHVTGLADLTTEESEQFGLMARRASLALQRVTDCEKTYLMLFAEAEGFSHLHVHVVPRMPGFEPNVLGPKVFAYLDDDAASWVPEAEMDALALQVRAAWSI